MKYIHIAIKESSNLNLSIIEKEFKSIIEKYQSDIDFVEYHLADDEEEQNYIDYLE